MNQGTDTMSPIKEATTLTVCQFEHMPSPRSKLYRGSFETDGASWSWGHNGYGFWAECIEAYDDRGVDVYALYFERETLAAVFTAVAEAVDASWAHVVITDDFGKVKRVRLSS